MMLAVWRRWQGVPRSVLLVVAVLVAVLGYGGVVHVVQLAIGGWPPYRWAPIWLASYFTSLTLLDPLAALLLGPSGDRAVSRHPYPRDGRRRQRVCGLQPARCNRDCPNCAGPREVLALAAVIMAPRVRRWMHPVPRMWT